MIRVIIVDDHPALRSGIRSALSAAEGFEVLGEAGGGRALFALLEEFPRGSGSILVVLDLYMPDQDGLEILSRLHAERPEVKVLMLTMGADPALAFRVMALGADGLASKETPLDTLVLALRLVAAGQCYIEAEVLRDIVTAASGQRSGRIEAAARFARLLPRERELLDLLLSGKEMRAAAEILGLGQRMTETLKESLTEKLGADSPIAIAQLAIRAGIVDS